MTDSPDIPAYRIACMRARAGPVSQRIAFTEATGLAVHRIEAIADGMTPTAEERVALDLSREREAKP